jgi:hypothetical protein
MRKELLDAYHRIEIDLYGNASKTTQADMETIHAALSTPDDAGGMAKIAESLAVHPAPAVKARER